MVITGDLGEVQRHRCVCDLNVGILLKREPTKLLLPSPVVAYSLLKLGPRSWAHAAPQPASTAVNLPSFQTFKRNISPTSFCFFCCQYTGAEVANASEGLVILYL